MKPKHLLFSTALAPSLAAFQLCAAPLTWFAGPALPAPVSRAATTVIAGGNNLLIGGDTPSGDYGFAASLAATNDYWSYWATIPGTVIAPGAVFSGGLVILYGGSDGAGSTSAVTSYSSTDGALTLHPMTVARSYHGYAPDRNGNAYAFGGLDGNGLPLSSAECYNPDADAWTGIASLPTTLYNFPAVFNRTNDIYVFGGLTDTVSGVETASVFRYSVSGNRWTAMAPMPVAVAGSAATLGPDGKIYVVGGTAGGVATDAVQVYDPVANSWSLFTPLPEALSGAAVGVDTLGRLVVMGGMDINGNDVGDVWRSQQLNVPDSPPVFSVLPGVSAVYQVPYVSTILATGNPQPVYQLVSGPDGMQVDPNNGDIRWTPQGINQIGTIPVTIQAANFAGFTNWSFNITVPNPPPAAPTNLTVVNVTENSVTLAWDPADPVAGVVTYSVWLRHVLHDPKGSGATIWYTQIGSSTTSTTLTISGLSPGVTQSYYVKASGPGGTSGYSAISATTWSVQPPASPQVTGLTSTSISFSWTAPSGPVPAVSYEIWGWDNFGISAVNASYGSGILNTSCTISGLAPGSSHNWAVRAYDAQGYASAFAFFNNGYLVANPVPSPAALSAVAASVAAGGFQFSVHAGAAQTIYIQATTNPADPTSWTTIATNPPAAGAILFTDTDSVRHPCRFYRVISP